MARQSEAAPAPAAPAPAAKPSGRSSGAQALGIPDFSQESPAGAPVAMTWNDYEGTDDGGGMPVSNSGPDMAGTSQEGAPRPTGPRAKVDVTGTNAESVDPIDPSDDGHVAPLADDAVEVDAEPETPKPTSSERRRAAMDALGHEQQRRQIETSLIAERERADKAERLLKEGTLGDLMRARNMDRDTALELLIAGKEGATAEPEAEGDPQVRALKAEVDRLKAADARRDAEQSALQAQRQVELVEAAAKGVTEATVVHAAIKAGTVVDWDAKTGRPMGASEVISRVAESEWRKAGSPKGKQMAYVKQATTALEEELIERSDPLAKAIAAKRGVAVDPPEPRRGITRRIAARPDAKPKPLPVDREARDAAIKSRYNLR